MQQLNEEIGIRGGVETAIQKLLSLDRYRSEIARNSCGCGDCHGKVGSFLGLLAEHNPGAILPLDGTDPEAVGPPPFGPISHMGIDQVLHLRLPFGEHRSENSQGLNRP